MISRALLALLVLLLSACGSDDSAPFLETVEESLLDLSSLNISSTESLLDVDTSRQLSVTAVNADGESQDFTTQAHWSSDNSLLATVSSGGLVSAVGPGTVLITASYGSLSDTISLTVSDAELLSLALSASEISVNECQNIQLTATGSYDDGSQRDVTELLSWSSGDSSLGTFDTRSSYEGLLRTFNAGTTNTLSVSGSYKGISDELDVSINDSLMSMTMLPGSPTLEISATQAFSVTAQYSDGSQSDISDNANWTLVDSGSGTGIGSIDNTFPDKGTFTAISTGNILVQADCGGPQSTNSVTVTAANTLQRVEINDGENPIEINDGDELSLTLIAIYSVSSDVDVTESASWSVISGDTGLISVDNTSGNKGEISYTGTGSVIIQATYNDEQSFTEVTVTAN